MRSAWQELEHEELRRREQPHRQAARPEPGADDQVAAVLDDVAARVALAVAGRDERAAHVRERDLAAVRVAGDRERDAARARAGRRRGRGRARARARRRARPRARGRRPGGGGARRPGRRRGSARPARRRRRDSFSSTGIPASASAVHIRMPNCFQSWLPSTATEPSGARRPARRSAIRSGASRPPNSQCASVKSPPSRTRSGASAFMRSTQRATTASPAWRTPACRSVSTPTRRPASASGQRGSASAVAAHDEPARLDPAGVDGEPRRGERECRARRRRPLTRRTSSRRGMPSRAPAARVESAAAATANAVASRSARPSASAVASAPLKVSPAPVVSTASTRGAGTSSASPPSSTSTPRAPSVTRTAAPVRAASARAAASGSRSPVSSQASPALGVSTGPSAASASGTGRAGAGLRTIGPRAARAPASTAASGTSWLSSTAPGPASRTARSDRGGAELGVGAGGDRDLVLARRVDGDQRDAGRRVQPRHAPDVDPLALEQRQRLVAEVVGADRADHRHARAEPRRRDGLVGALAAAVAGEAPAGDGLAGRGQPLGDHDQVGVDRADDDDLCPRASVTRGTLRAAAAPSGTGRHARAGCGRNPPRAAARPAAGGRGGNACPSAVAPYSSWRSSCSPSRRRPRSPATAVAARVMATRRRTAACASRHRPELLLRHGRPVRQRRRGERQRRPAARQGRRPVRLRPDGQGLVPRRRPEGPHGEDRLHQGARHDRDLADAELQEQGRPAAGQLGGLPRLLDHRLHPDRPAPGHQRRTCARSSTPRTRAGSRSTSTSSPTTRPT